MLMDIINEIISLIKSKIPNAQVDIIKPKEGITRPSFFITYYQSTTDHLNRYFYNNNILIQIIYYASLNSDGKVDAVDQYKTYDILMDIFADGYFKVGDRAVKIREITGAPKDADVYLKLNLDVTGEKTYTLDNDENASEIVLTQKGGIK